MTTEHKPTSGRCPSCGLSPYEAGIGDADISRIVAERNSLLEQLEAAQKRLSEIRPLRDTEWAVLMREHDVLYAARRLSRSVGEINATAHLDRALKRYDEAVVADRDAESSPASRQEER